MSGGTVKCRGKNTHGQLGDGTTIQRETPVPVTGLTNVSQIDIGDDHSCAKINDGTIKCRGGNYFGQLGDGTTIQRETPVFVQN